jgi:hypothetical protein
MQAATKKGDLDGALKIRDMIKTYESEIKIAETKTENDKFTKLVEQWDTINAEVVKIDAKKASEIDLSSGQSWMIIPNPKDRWKPAQNKDWPDVDFSGDDRLDGGVRIQRLSFRTDSRTPRSRLCGSRTASARPTSLPGPRSFRALST